MGPSHIPQTFGFRGHRDLIAKLRWEIERIIQDHGWDAAVLAYRGFNAAVTAWQISDWLWEDMTDSQRKAIGVAHRTALQNKARRECRALHCCRQIATAHKHAKVTLFPDPTVESAVSADRRLANEGFTVEQVVYVLKIIDGQDRLPAIQLFKDALDYWTDLARRARRSS